MICVLCPRRCDLSEGQTGFCRARKNERGTIVCKNYGRVTSLALDPVEKKPFARFCPGSYILSVGSYGCNLRCPFCQNHEISMADETAGTIEVTPEALTEKALELRDRGNIGLAFTYNEPIVGFEFVRDCAALAKGKNLKTALVTNGMLEPEPLLELLPLIDAMNIDLKGFTEKFYQYVGGRLETVKKTIAAAAKSCHVEVTTLVIPGLNDGADEMEREAKWLASIDPEIPLHISRFFPRYRLTDRAATPVEAVRALREVAEKYLKYVYTGNC